MFFRQDIVERQEHLANDKFVHFVLILKWYFNVEWYNFHRNKALVWFVIDFCCLVRWVLQQWTHPPYISLCLASLNMEKVCRYSISGAPPINS